MYLCKTYFSFKYGTYSTKELVSGGIEAGATTLALTNINSTCDTWDFVQYCREAGVRPIVGAEIRNGNKLLYILLAANNTGFQRINAFLSEHLLAERDFPDTPTGLYQRPQDGFTIYPFGSRPPEDLQDNEKIGIQLHEVNRLLRTTIHQTAAKWVIRQPVTFQNKIYHNLHRLLRAVDRNTLLSKLIPEDIAGADEYFVPQADILTAFRGYPSIITNTCRLIDACSIEMTFGEHKNKRLYSASREDDRVLLEKLAREGFRLRYGNNRKARERLQKELNIIDQMGFTAYYLITWDMIRYAQSRGFYHVGRGSGANS
ncbi:MAG TPA: PHP domain-containing protein, partial [Puia sp.]|nr:PHP domain-containing protein [Puia sp.]